MAKNTSFEPRWASAPGETILDSLNKWDLSLTAFAEGIGKSPEATDRLLSGEAPIDRELAERLHQVIGGSSRFWLEREAQYRHDLERLNTDRSRDVFRNWLRELPIRDMVKFHWIRPTNDKMEQASECLKFFNTPTVADWRQNYQALMNVIKFRSSGAFESNLGSVAAWLRRGEMDAASIECPPWNCDKFGAKLQAIRLLTRKKDPEIFLPKLQQFCAECGVAMVVVRAPAGCRISGATRFISPTKALLLLSFRYRTDDQFWFTFFHEAAHLLLHDRRALFIEGAGMLSTHEEEEANQFSANTLVPPDHQEDMLNLSRDYRTIMRWARHVGVSPGIIVGQLQHHGLLTRNQMNFLKTRFLWQDELLSFTRGTG